MGSFKDVHNCYNMTRNFEIPSETITCIISYIFGEKSAMWRHFRSNAKKMEKMFINSKQQIILGTLFIVWRKIGGEEKIPKLFLADFTPLLFFSCNQRVLSKQPHSRTYEDNKEYISGYLAYTIFIIGYTSNKFSIEDHIAFP